LTSAPLMAMGHLLLTPKTLPRLLGDGSDDTLGRQWRSPSARISPRKDAHPAAPPPAPLPVLTLACPPTIIVMAMCIKGGQRWRLGATFGCGGGKGGEGCAGERKYSGSMVNNSCFLFSRVLGMFLKCSKLIPCPNFEKF
jgi:hypothetical protein